MRVVTVGRAALATINLLIAQGADNAYSFRYSNDGVPVDLTGWSARAQIRSDYGGDIYLTLTAQDIPLTSDGVIQITIPHTVTEATEWNAWTSGVWDLELVDPNGGVTRFAAGRVTISQDVTRDV